MRVVYCLGAPPTGAPLGKAVVALDGFEGVHTGHRRLLERTAELAAGLGASAVAAVLWPDRSALSPDAAPRLLTTLEERLDLLERLALLDAVVVLPFDASAPGALLATLCIVCEPQALVTGTELALGDGMSGANAPDDLRDAAMRRGLPVETVDTSGDGHRHGAAIHEALAEGSLERVNRQLGHPYLVSGEVVAGDRRGRTIGFPTANLRLDPRKALPANGVYAVRVALPREAEATHSGVGNIGVRPTFGGEPRLLIELHLLDAAMDLYGVTLRAELIARLREERRFGGIDELRAQIARDAEAARTLLARPPEPEPTVLA